MGSKRLTTKLDNACGRVIRHIEDLAVGDLARHGDGTLEPARDADPELGKQSADHVHQLRALFDQQLARAVQSQRAACCSRDFTATNRMVGRVTASQIASASLASVLPRFT